MKWAKLIDLEDEYLVRGTLLKFLPNTLLNRQLS